MSSRSPLPAERGARRRRRRASGLLALGLLVATLACDDPADTYRIGGHVRLTGGAALEGVRVVVTWPGIPGMERPLTTDTEGWYGWEWGQRLWGFEEDDLAHVVVTPDDPGYTFDPASYDLVLQGKREDLDFEATPAGGATAGILWMGLLEVGAQGRGVLAELEWRVRSAVRDVRSGSDRPGPTGTRAATQSPLTN